jgi:ferritin-like metal-binding protein YciE
VPAPLSNPRDLYLTALAEMLFVERMLSFEVLPELLGSVRDASLAGALAGHLAETKGHVLRVEEAFGAASAETSSNHSPPFVGLKEQHTQLAHSANADALADLVHTHAAVATEHFEIARYGALIPLAAAVAPDALDLLRENLAEEERALAALQQLLGELTEASAGGARVRG